MLFFFVYPGWFCVLQSNCNVKNFVFWSEKNVCNIQMYIYFKIFTDMPELFIFLESNSLKNG